MNNITALIQHFKIDKIDKAALKKWRLWAYRILRRKNFPIDLSICAYGKSHIVERTKPFGGGYIFWSKACSGCAIGQAIIDIKKRKNIEPDKAHCRFLESGLLTRDQIKTGDIYTLSD